MRLFSLVVTTVFLAASAASALEFSVLGASNFTILEGDSITIDLALTNNNGDAVAGITGELSGLGGGLGVVSGQSAIAHVTQFCSPTNCFGGVNTVNNAFFNPDDLRVGAGSDVVTIISSLGLSPSVANGANDPGLDGGADSPSDRDVTITLIALAGSAGNTYSLIAGGSFSDGANTLPIVDTAGISVTVIPEPGTALLMGLGLAGLATAGRRR